MILSQSVLLFLLDLSAAFDTVNHDFLIERLNVVFKDSVCGTHGAALHWFRSYLCNRSQFVKLDDCNSEASPLETSVPQGSVLGPLLIPLYMRPIGGLISRHGIDYHFYADDFQLYLSFSNSQPPEALSTMET